MTVKDYWEDKAIIIKPYTQKVVCPYCNEPLSGYGRYKSNRKSAYLQCKHHDLVGHIEYNKDNSVKRYIIYSDKRKVNWGKYGHK